MRRDLTPAVRPASLPEEDLEGLGFQQCASARWFYRMGFTSERSVCLALAGAPPARVERALLADCSLETAFDIWT